MNSQEMIRKLFEDADKRPLREGQVWTRLFYNGILRGMSDGPESYLLIDCVGDSSSRRWNVLISCDSGQLRRSQIVFGLDMSDWRQVL